MIHAAAAKQLAKKPCIGCASILAVAPLESAYDEVRPRHLLKVVDDA
jgi:hypothetical protein